ncbi:anhydro-N-acetylmuramic acid kinase [Algoriphagus halophytocola]|uniref:Anhydro-N-acetylmuramic acid kinase n=1 Tax=Algoriphagus halophytocola TaxID=2991499 RepID=A0ABY6ME60_9BACT|nr:MULTISPECIES: anhydro-N-acetylmuramic acid kinase [unclassified Algoriphagus]UZD21679.1 anhydro-N-acetylmuramic acid kinase [Algoriphagus sp. TR-M5]WBL42891.1 anhydro-N-acetylmuramic acid kinase [Algoriphagus sp. TR-M9]
MSPKTYNLIGLMSGTSGDGLDLAYCSFQLQDQWTFEIMDASTIPFPEKLGSKLMGSHRLSALDLALLDVEFGQWMGEQVKAYCAANNAHPLAVCSHGHTVFHQPKQGLSLQIGNGFAMHQRSGQRVINDFRMLDVQLGGQGAPLVPIGDRLLFPKMDFCINLGGIANISMEQQGKRIAFDTCPFNLLLNAQAQKLGAAYDANGAWAKEGTVSDTLLAQLNALDYYQTQSVKSLGRENLERDFEPLIGNSGLSEKDILSTLVEHYAIQISKTIQHYQPSEKPSVLITGGGAYNSYFIERLDAQLQGKWTQDQANSQLIEFKEALVFGFLGLLKLRGEDNCLASVTGAKSDSCGGVIYG